MSWDYYLAELEKWLVIHGLENVKYFPLARELWHLDHPGPHRYSSGLLRELVEAEWEAIQEYHRACTEAAQECRWQVRRAAESYLMRLKRIRQTWRESVKMRKGVAG